MLSEKIKSLREKSHLTQNQAADKLGLTPRALGYYELGQRKPSPETLVNIANFYNVSVDYLLGITEEPHGTPKLSNSEYPQSVTKVKILGKIRAGMPLLAVENVEGEILLPKELLSASADYFMLRVLGNSMTGDGINDNDFVLIKVQDHIDFDGQIASVIVDQEDACLKHVHISDKYVVLRSSNPANPDIIRPLHDVKINGVMSGYMSRK